MKKNLQILMVLLLAAIAVGLFTGSGVLVVKHKELIPVSIGMVLIGAIALGFYYLYAEDVGRGKILTVDDLREEIAILLGHVTTTKGQIVAILEYASGEVRAVASESLPKDAKYVLPYNDRLISADSLGKEPTPSAMSEPKAPEPKK